MTKNLLIVFFVAVAVAFAVKTIGYHSGYAAGQEASPCKKDVPSDMVKSFKTVMSGGEEIYGIEYKCTSVKAGDEVELVIYLNCVVDENKELYEALIYVKNNFAINHPTANPAFSTNVNVLTISMDYRDRLKDLNQYAIEMAEKFAATENFRYCS